MPTRRRSRGADLPARVQNTALARRFKTGQRRSDFSYQTITGLKLDQADLSHSMFTGAILRGCTFRNVNFYRCDFDAVRIEKCHFENCNMSGDFRASTITSSTLIDCLLDKSLVTESVFDRCDLTRVTLADSAVTSNRFVNSAFNDCSFRMSTYLKNVALGTSFTETFMGDCTLRYAIMRSCTFSRCVMNLESVGMIYGLTPADLAVFDYMYRGVPQTIPPGVDLIDLLTREYAQRKWALGTAILQINARVVPAVVAWHDYFADLLSSRRRTLPINAEELTFVATLFEQLLETEDLPLHTSLEAADAAARLAKRQTRAQTAAARETRRWIDDFGNRVTTLLHGQLDRLGREPLQRALEGADIPSEVVLSFEHQPDISGASAIQFAVESSGISVASPTVTIAERHGSFHEHIETTIQSLAMLQVALFLLNGSIVGVTEAKERLRVLLRRRSSKEYEAMARTPKQTLPAFLAGPLQQLARSVLRLPMTADHDLAGYSRENVTGADIVAFPTEPQPPPKTPARRGVKARSRADRGKRSA